MRFLYLKILASDKCGRQIIKQGNPGAGYIKMKGADNILETTKNLISVLELRRLLVDLREKRPDICVRYRLIGEMWVVNSMRVLKVTEKGVMFNDERNNKLITLPDLSAIMQFEIDAPFQGFQPHFHYEVRPMNDFKA